MMFHHDGRTYEEATSHAGKVMKQKLTAEIDAARQYSVNALQRIEREIPMDLIVPAPAMLFDEQGGRLGYHVVGPESMRAEGTIHPWALGQIAETVAMPKTFINALMALREGDEPWGAKLAAINLTELMGHRKEKHLVRTVDGNLRGFLSPRYQRRHPGVLLDTFLAACKEFNLLPARAFASDTKHGVHAVLDAVLEPVPNEFIGLGVFYGESPFGNGATEVSISMKRMWCSNLAVAEQNLRAVHSGGSLSEDIVWSDETYKKDTQLAASKMRDMLKACVGPEFIVKTMDSIREANDKKLTGGAFETFLKKALSKEDGKAVLATFNSADVELLPPGNTVWRASNAISAFANTTEDEEKKLDLQKLAGRALTAFN